MVKRLDSTGTITGFLHRMQNGDPEAPHALLSHAQEELRRIARRRIREARGQQSLQVTAVVNEACARLLEHQALNVQDRRHFFFVFSRAMRDVLVEAIRGECARKRGGGWQRLAIGEFVADGHTHAIDLLDLHDALNELQECDPEGARIIELRFFNGLTLHEAADTMGCTFAIARRHWDYAKAWLFERLSRGESSPG